MEFEYNVGRRRDKLFIKEFNMNIIREDPLRGFGVSIEIIAPSGSGKTWVVKAILEKIKDYPCGVIISETEKIDPFYSKFCPETYIYDEFKPEIVAKVLMRQETIFAFAEEQERKYGKKIDTRCFLVMDDCCSDIKVWTQMRIMKKLLYEGRHFNITFILTMQYPLGLSPELRSNISYVFALADDKINNQRRIRDHYAGMFPSYEAFRQIFMQMTYDYGCLVIKNRGASSNALDKIFHYKAPDLSHTEFIIGCKNYKKFHELNYRSKEKRKRKTIDIAEFCTQKKKNKEQINIDFEN